MWRSSDAIRFRRFVTGLGIVVGLLAAPPEAFGQG